MSYDRRMATNPHPHIQGRKYMSDNPEGKDGLARNIARFKKEMAEAKAVIKAQKGSHAPFINACVEYCRHAPFPTGHFLALLLVLQPILIGLLIWRW